MPSTEPEMTALDHIITALINCRTFLYSDTVGLVTACYPGGYAPTRFSIADFERIDADDRPALTWNIELLRDIERACGRDTSEEVWWLCNWIDHWPFSAEELSEGRPVQ